MTVGLVKVGSVTGTHVDLWDSFVGKEEMYARDGLHLSGKGAAVFAEGLSGAVASRVLHGPGLGPRAGPARSPWAGPGQDSMIFCGPGRAGCGPETCRPGPGPGW